MEFVANLRPETVVAFARHEIQPRAYLLSTHRATKRMIRYAHELREKGSLLFADNGTKPLIDQVIEKFRVPSRAIGAEFRQVRRRLGRTPRGRSVPLDLRQRAQELARTVVRECTERSQAIDWMGLLDQQLAMDPTHLIAQEDFAVACLIALSLERETLGWRLESWDRRNQRSLRLFERVASDPRCRALKVYAVLSATDYNSALSAGKMAARFGATHVAIGLAGIMADPAAVDFFVMGRGSHTLEHPAPRRYVRFAQVLRGIAEGYQAAGTGLQGFHALGLGAATMFPIFGAAVDFPTTLSVDATSPVRDAVRDHVLYHPDRNGDRLSHLDIASGIVRGLDWPCQCFFCRSFRDQYGHSMETAQEWWEGAGKPKIQRHHLSAGEPLAAAIPLFTWAASPVGREATRTHVAHNHWVLGQLAEALPDDAARRRWAVAKIEELLGYESLVTARGLSAARVVLQKSRPSA